MNIDIIAVGHLKEPFWREAAAEYLKRLSRYASVRVTEVADKDPAQGTGHALAKEAAGIMRTLPQGAHVIALDVAGKQVSSEEFAQKLDQLALEGKSHVAFVLGGSHGIDRAVLAHAAERLSFGPITLPHNLARIVLLEQVYRAFRISRGEPYHK